MELDDYLALSRATKAGEDLPSMFGSKDGLAQRTYDPADEDEHKISKSWWPVLVSIAGIVVGVGLYQLYERQSPVSAVRAPAGANFVAGSMEEVISAASERLSNMADNKLPLAQPKNDGERSANEQLLKRLQAWMDKNAPKQPRRGYNP
jgi:hypothetical protein